MTNLQTAVEATDECRRSFEEWYVKDYGEKEYYKSNTKAQVWVAFQAAWNARQPEAPPSEVPIPTVEEIADHIDAIAYDYLSTVEQSNFMYRVKELLTARLKGADHE